MKKVKKDDVIVEKVEVIEETETEKKLTQQLADAITAAICGDTIRKETLNKVLNNL